MVSFDKKQVDFLKALADLFYEKIRPDAHFRNSRIEEWCENYPVPPKSSLDSQDLDALDKIVELHKQLELVDEKNTVKGFRWGKYVINDFTDLLEEFKNLIEISNVDPSISNLYHVHYSVLLRAKGQYSKAIQQLRISSEIMEKKINSTSNYLPRYNREIIQNKGAISELYRLNNEIGKAINEADNMLADAKKAEKNSDFVTQDKKGLCPVASWAMYYNCEAHLAVEEWDKKEAEQEREWIFSHTFSNHVYRDWTVPVLIRIIGNIVWENRYPHYFEKIADLVYIDTADGKLKTTMREMSVLMGRIRIKPTMPVTLVAIIAFCIIQLNVKEAKANGLELKPNKAIERTIGELGNVGFTIDEDELEEIQKEIYKEVNRQHSDLVASSDRGVGVGMHQLLPMHAIASDRGVGVG